MFAEKVRTLLKSKRWSQTHLASLLGTSQQVVSKWLKKDKPPKAEYLVKLAEVLGVSVDYLTLDSVDKVDKPAVGETLDPNERTVLTTFRALGLHVEEAVRRLHGTESVPPTVVTAPGASVAEREAAREGERKRAANGEFPKKPKPGTG